MNHHYVLAPHDPDLADRATRLVDSHQPGHGVRAIASAHRESDFGHVIALQASDEQALQALLESLEFPFHQADAMSPASAPLSLSLTVCGDVPCEYINQLFGFVPSQLPACEEIVFLLMELDRDLHEIVDKIHVPPVDSHLAGVAIANGNTLLIELGNDDPDQLERDVAELLKIAHVRSVRKVHAAGHKLVRSDRR
ncbi:MAG: hypothetical protein JJD92_10555 [Frankiaceae bacterium]|nr:hypothetical protein [Frankiaceae bacterium]